jgi:hypothetical protein
MICPEQRLKSFLNQNNNNNNQRNSICIELTGCSIDESSTDDCQLIKSSADRYWTKSTMSVINQNEIMSSTQPLTVIDECKVNHDNETDEEEKGKKKAKRRSLSMSIILFPVELIALQFVSFLSSVQYHHHYLTIITTVNRRLSFFHHLRQLCMLL